MIGSELVACEGPLIGFWAGGAHLPLFPLFPQGYFGVGVRTLDSQAKLSQVECDVLFHVTS